MECEPAFGYGLRRATWQHTENGYHQAVAVAEDDDDLPLTLTTDLRLGFEGPRAVARTLLKEGETRFCVLSWGEAKPPKTYVQAYKRLNWTSHHWQHWLAGGRIPDHPWKAHLARSALTLKGLSYAPTGAIAAAATCRSSTASTAGGT
jgi:alpha,alpha-trehalase